MRNGTSASPRNGCQYKALCNQSGNNGNGTTFPDNTITRPIMMVLKPRPDSVQMSATCRIIVIADASSTVAVNDMMNNTPFAKPSGGRNAYSCRPTNGKIKPTRMIIGTIRSVVVAVRSATVRANQNVYRS